MSKPYEAVMPSKKFEDVYDIPPELIEKLEKILKAEPKYLHHGYLMSDARRRVAELQARINNNDFTSFMARKRALVKLSELQRAIAHKEGTDLIPGIPLRKRYEQEGFLEGLEQRTMIKENKKC